MDWFEKLLSKNRKLKLTLLFFLTVSVMLFFGKVSSQGYLDFLKWTLGLYVGGNALSKIGGKKNVTHNHYDIPPDNTLGDTDSTLRDNR